MLTVTVIFLSASVSASAAAEIPVYVNGTPIQSDVPAQIISDRTMVPMRAIFDSLGAEVEWNDAEKKATAKLGDITVSIRRKENIHERNRKGNRCSGADSRLKNACAAESRERRS